MSSLLKEIGNVMQYARLQAENSEAANLILNEEQAGTGEFGPSESNIFYLGDNIRFLKTLAANDEYRGKIQMIYIDPPFFTKSDYEAVLSAGGRKLRHPAYQDTWKKGLYEYLRNLAARLLLMKELLREDGLIFVHLDWHASHYVKIIMDEIFGEDQFVNELIWTYKSGGSTKKHFSRKHDTILMYSKTKKYVFYPQKEKSYNRGMKPYRFHGVKEYEDEHGWYTLVNMKDVWSIDMVGRTSSERTGYASQKPEQLIERMMRSATKKGDLTADFFSGSGTLPAVASRLGRRFIACDIGNLAASYTMKRVQENGAGMSLYADQPFQVMTEESNPPFRIRVDCETEQQILPEEKLLKIIISDFFDLRFGKDIKDTDRIQARELASENPLALLDSWSLDPHFDGHVFRPAAQFIRRNGKLQYSYQNVFRNPGRMVIKAQDIFGRSIAMEIFEKK
ncbi:MAG: site-specific DNA-methyltransferase [Eubacteriales bacterium]|nr:site-specific DNA-methyltransferase [Eubacteriales bacterium]